MKKKYIAMIVGTLLSLNMAIIPAHAEDKYPSWEVTDGIYYLKNPDGTIVKGWSRGGTNNDWYYLKNDGTRYTGWLQDGGKWYYLYLGGDMAVDTVIDGHYINYYGELTSEKSTDLVLEENWPSSTRDALAQTVQLLETAESNPTEQTIEDLIVSYNSISIGIDDLHAYEAVRHNMYNTYDRVFLRIVEVICKLPSDSRDAKLIHFTQEMADSWWATYSAGYNSFYKNSIGYMNSLYITSAHDGINKVWMYVLNQPSYIIKAKHDGLDLNASKYW